MAFPFFQIPSSKEKAIRDAKFGMTQKRSSVLKQEELLARIQDSLRRIGAVSEIASVGNVTCNSTGNTFSIQLQIGDWQGLDLGTTNVNSLADVDGLVSTMLTDKTSSLRPVINGRK